MAVPVANVKSQDMVGGMVKGALPAVGQFVGNMYGGPAGGMAGGMLGGEMAKGFGAKDVAPVESSPIDRRMGQIENDPLNQLKQGKAALSGMDPDTQAKLSPVLDEAIKKAALQKQGGTGGGPSI